MRIKGRAAAKPWEFRKTVRPTTVNGTKLPYTLAPRPFLEPTSFLLLRLLHRLFFFNLFILLRSYDDNASTRHDTKHPTLNTHLHTYIHTRRRIHTRIHAYVRTDRQTDSGHGHTSISVHTLVHTHTHMRAKKKRKRKQKQQKKKKTKSNDYTRSLNVDFLVHFLYKLLRPFSSWYYVLLMTYLCM